MPNVPIKTKIFQAGGSQAARIPMEFRFPAKVTEVLIRRDALTGHLVISQKPPGWMEFFSFLDELMTPDLKSDQLRLELGGSGQ